MAEIPQQPIQYFLFPHIFAEDDSAQTGSGPSGSINDYALMEAVMSRRDADALAGLYDKHSGLVLHCACGY